MNDGDQDPIQMDDEPVDIINRRAEPAMRYFSAQNCRRWPDLFEPFDTLGGILWGICATADREKLSMIEALIAQPKLGVTEISQEDYTKQAQKKIAPSPASVNFSPRPAQSLVSPVNLAGNEPQAPKAAVGFPIPSLPIPPGTPILQQPMASAMKGPGAVVGEVTAPEPGIEAGKPVPSVSEALQLGEVEPAPTAKVRNSRKK